MTTNLHDKMLAAIDALFSASDAVEEEVAENLLLDVRDEIRKQPAQPLTDIYRGFEQWKNGNVLEHGVPRTEYYSEQELSLVEMGWKYGYDAGRAVEPTQQEPVALWTEAQHERAYRNSPELHNDVKSLAAFKRVAKEIAAMYGITKGNT